MGWQAEIKIQNNTQYSLTITGTGDGPNGETYAPGEEITWSSTSVNNAKALCFNGPNPPTYMQGGLSFGPEAGVYVDRGWQAADDQTITMTATAGGVLFTQDENGGKEILQWNQFESGGNIVMIFSQK
jgi:hypothetical protein